MALEKMYEITEISEMIGVSYRKLKKDLYAGELIAHKIAGRWRSSESEIRAYIDAAPTNQKENGTDEDKHERSTVLSDTSSAGDRAKRGSRRKAESSV